MDIKNFIKDLKNERVELSLDSNQNIQISYDTNKKLENEVVTNIRHYKEQIIKHLQSEANPNDEPKEKITPFQKGLISFAKTEPKSARYIIRLTYEIEQSLSFPVLSKAVKTLAARHEIIRSTYDFNAETNDFVVKAVDVDKIDIREILLEDELSYRQELFEISKAPLIKLALVDKKKIILSIHHIIVDVNSIHIILKELLDIYRKILTNTPTDSETNPIQFTEYVDWLSKKDKIAAQQYWRNLLANSSPTLLENVTAVAEPHPLDEFVELKLNTQLSKEYRKFALENRLTSFTVLNFITGFVLSQYCGDEYFIWGNSITHRYSSPDFHKIVGPCISTIPVKYAFRQEKSILNALAEFQQQLVNSREYSHIPLNDIYRCSETENLFSALFSFQDMSEVTDIEEKNIGFKRKIEENEVTSHFPLALLATQLDNTLEFTISYKSQLFEKEHVEEIAKTIISTINEIDSLAYKNLNEQNPLQHYSPENLAIVKGHEKSIGNKRFIDTFQKQVHQNPTATAVEDYDGGKLTYLELDRKSNYIAKLLIQSGIRGAVGIHQGSSINLAVSIVAIIKAGCYMISMEPGFPIEKLHWLAEVNKLRAIIIEGAPTFAEELPETCQRLCIEEDIPEEIEDYHVQTSLLDLCAVYYTSGSTGTPKLVKTSHLNTLNGLTWLEENFPANQADVFCLNIKLAFSPAVRNLFECLCQGAKIIIVPEFLHQNVSKFLGFVLQTKVSRLSLTPSFLNVLLETGEISRLEKLKILEIRGEAIRMDEITKIRSKLPTVQLLVRYGATEASSTAYNFNHFPATNKYCPLGQPTNNTSISIVDTHLKVKPRNVIGEILIESISLSSGYIDDPDNPDNNDVFVKSGNNKQLLKTGDLGFIDRKGVLHYAGRKNRMIKIRGYRIEPREVEYHLEEYPGVERAVVLANETENGTRLVAFCQPNSSFNFSEQNIKHYLKSKIPNYMLPNQIRSIEQFPTTGSGKVDQISLLKSLQTEETKFENNPRTTTEKRLNKLIGDLLHMGNIPIDKDFYSLGIDSIILMRTTFEIEKEFNLVLSASELFEYDTVEKLSTYIDQISVNGDSKHKEHYYKLNYKDSNKDILFLVPPLTGNSNYKVLTPHIPTEIDFIVFDTIKQENYDDVGRDMETLASFYKNTVLKLSKGKNVHLAGWSFGASLAFEIAAQLESIGQHVPSLILLDPTFYNPDFDTEEKTHDDYLKILCHLLREEGIDPEDFGTERIINQMYHANQVAKNYRLKKYAGNISLIKPESVSPMERNYNRPFNGLEEYCTGNISVSKVKGNHMTMTIGPAKFLAETIFSNINKLSS